MWIDTLWILIFFSRLQQTLIYVDSFQIFLKFFKYIITQNWIMNWYIVDAYFFTNWSTL